jgi:hypothetical protein
LCGRLTPNRFCVGVSLWVTCENCLKVLDKLPLNTPLKEIEAIYLEGLEKDAAPDLLKALREMLREYPDCGCTGDAPDSRGRVCGSCLARAAIAKAEGKRNIQSANGGSEPSAVTVETAWIEDLLSERDALKAKLEKAVQYLKEGKARFAPGTTNSFVDDFIAENAKGEEG